MLSIAMPSALFMIAVAMALNLWRLVRGPGPTGRVLALDTLAIDTIALIMLFGISPGNPVYLDVALLIAMMGFVGTAALCKFALSGDIIE